MKLEQAKELAEAAKAELEPYCHRIEIAGSIRRQKPDVGDIELVCVPMGMKLTGFVDAVNKWSKIKGSPKGKYTQREYHGMKLDLFICTPSYCMKCGNILSSRHEEIQDFPKTPIEKTSNLSPLVQTVSSDAPANQGTNGSSKQGGDSVETAESEGTLSHSLQATLQPVSSVLRGRGKKVLQPKLSDEMVGGKAETQFSGRKKPGLERRSLCDERRLCDVEETGASDGRQETLRNGTPIGDGEDARKKFNTQGNSTSQERDQERQPGRKSGSDAPGSAHGESELSSLRSGILHQVRCSHCNSPNIKSGTWACNFAIRTGSAWFSHGLAARALQIGLRFKGAQLCRGDLPLSGINEEKDVFETLRIKWVDPEKRIGQGDIVPL
jgi:hypothetical protein